MNKIKSSPFILTPTGTKKIMAHVIIALLPVIIMAVVRFGHMALVQVLAGLISAVLFEYIFQRLTGRDITITDGSACVTGLLTGLAYPVTAPIWIVVLSSFIAIVLIKQLPGGIGKNPFNPAVFARVFIKIVATPIMTDWVSPLPDMVSTPTPLESIGDGAVQVGDQLPGLYDLFMGNIGGNIGEVAKFAIIIGFIYLVVVKVIHPGPSLAAIGGLFFTMLLFSGSDYYFALYHVLSGTFLFAVVYMLTDYTSGPLNHRAKVYFGLGVGILTGIIRHGFGLPGGVGVAILIMNILAPALDVLSTPRVYGHRRSRQAPPRRN